MLNLKTDLFTHKHSQNETDTITNTQWHWIKNSQFTAQRTHCQTNWDLTEWKRPNHAVKWIYADWQQLPLQILNLPSPRHCFYTKQKSRARQDYLTVIGRLVNGCKNTQGKFRLLTENKNNVMTIKQTNSHNSWLLNFNLKRMQIMFVLFRYSSNKKSKLFCNLFKK